MGRGDEVDGGQEAGAAADLVGLRAPHGEQLEQLGPLRQAEVLEVGDKVIVGRLAADRPVESPPCERIDCTVS